MTTVIRVVMTPISYVQFQVAGPYLPQYEIYYKKLDVDGKGEIGAMDAAKFLKKSGLADDILGKVLAAVNFLIFLLSKLVIP